MGTVFLLELTLKEASKGFLISLRASRSYADSYLSALESALAFLAEYSESQRWPTVGNLTVAHLEDYFAWFAGRPIWFGLQGDMDRTPSNSYLDVNHRRLNRFFGWLVDRGHIEDNPMRLIGRPSREEKTVPTVSAIQMEMLLRVAQGAGTETKRRRFYSVGCL